MQAAGIVEALDVSEQVSAGLIAGGLDAVLTSAQLRVMIAVAVAVAVADRRSNEQIAHDLGLGEAAMRASRGDNGRPGCRYDSTDEKKAL